jgi:hypothetical protein
VPNNTASKYMKQKLIILKRKIDKTTIIAGEDWGHGFKW